MNNLDLNVIQSLGFKVNQVNYIRSHFIKDGLGDLKLLFTNKNTPESLLTMVLLEIYFRMNESFFARCFFNGLLVCENKVLKQIKENQFLKSVNNSVFINDSGLEFNGELWFKYSLGNTRKVLINKDKIKVLKVPLNDYSKEINLKEYNLSNTKDYFASCSLYDFDSSYLVMEYLRPVIDKFELTNYPDWFIELSKKNSKLEVGFDFNNNLKLLDYGDLNE